MADQPPSAAWTLPSPATLDVARGSPAAALAQQVVTLFDQLRDRLLRYVLGFGLPIQDAEDIVQEAFLHLFRHLQRGSSRTNLRAWLFRVAHNLALKRRMQVHTGPQPVPAGEAWLDSLADPHPNPEDQLAAGQRQQRVAALVAALPDQDRRCLMLRAEGLRYREIAQVLDVSLGAVALSLERALLRVTRALAR